MFVTKKKLKCFKLSENLHILTSVLKVFSLCLVIATLLVMSRAEINRGPKSLDGLYKKLKELNRKLRELLVSPATYV